MTTESGIYVPDNKLYLPGTTTTPFGYKPEELFQPVIYNPEKNKVEFQDCIFTGTGRIREVGQNFLRDGVYTKLHPVYDKREFNDFWDEEERRRRNGVVLDEAAYVKENGVYVAKKVWITGEHYGYLNYAQIMVTQDDEMKYIIKSKKRSKKRTFPDFWDWDFYYFHARQLAKALGKHMVVGKARRKGYSYKNGWCAANTYDLEPESVTIIGAHLMKYITKSTGMMTMASNYLDFLNKHTDWYKGRLTNSIEMLESGYKLEGELEKRGFRSKILALSFDSSADSAVGKDAKEIYLEEMGTFPNADEVLDITIPTLEDGTFTTGMLTAFGTGGSKDANWVTFERMFYGPGRYNMLAFENIWDENPGNVSCGFFHPHFMNLVPLIDIDGNSYKEAAKMQSQNDYEEHKIVETDPMKLLAWRGQRADRPEQSFSRSSNNYFYKPELEEHYKNVKNNEAIKLSRRIGIVSGGKLLESDKVSPVEKFPLTTTTGIDGCYVEFQAPYRDKITGKIPPNLYRLYNDPYATDKDADRISLRDSLGATIVYERLNNFTQTRGDIIIGMYVGRPPMTDDYNSHLFEIAEYVNGMIFFESDRGDVFQYAKRIKATSRLVDEPELIWAKELVGKSGRTYGMSMGDQKKKVKGAQLLRDWLYTKRGTDAYGNAKYNFHYIYDLGLLEELLRWSFVGNFDRVSAFILGMFDVQETLHIPITNNMIDEDDDFFTKDWF